MQTTTVIDYVLAHNADAVRDYANPDNALWRRQYRARCPTEIATLECMDGRLNMPIMCDVPVGIIHQFRNIGGKFDLGWSYFGLLVNRWVETAVKRGHDALVIVTYHYSKGNTHRGCAGWGYDTNAARNDAFAIKAQFERVFGNEHRIVYPIIIGIETDEDVFIVHGENGETLELASITETGMASLRATLRRLFPDMREQVVLDLLPLLEGNVKHVANVRAHNRTPVEHEHMEQVMGIGRGFDWLHIHNKALIIGPYEHNLREPVEKAAGILLSNLEAGRIPKDDGVVVMTSGTYKDENGPERLLAIEKALSYARFAKKTIEAAVPALVPHVSYLAGYVDVNTREYRRVPFA